MLRRQSHRLLFFLLLPLLLVRFDRRLVLPLKPKYHTRRAAIVGADREKADDHRALNGRYNDFWCSRLHNFHYTPTLTLSGLLCKGTAPFAIWTCTK